MSNPAPLGHLHDCLALALLLLLLPAALTSTAASTCPATPITPLLSFLDRVQSAAFTAFGPDNFDPKLYVDVPLKFGPASVEEAFDALPRSGNGSIPPKELEEFMTVYFDGAGDDLVHMYPPDFVPEPEGFLPKVEHPAVRAWALEVHALWKNLSRRVASTVRKRPELHTLLPLPEGFVIPGSRFREVYYWDSYWMIRGLLASKMYETAKGIVTNLIYLLDKYGHVLNGARAYYTNRSQPPLLSAMVRAIYNKTEDTVLVKKALRMLLKEYAFWTSGMHQVTIQDSEGNSHKLSRYFAMWNKPRPESATIDEHFASNISSIPKKRQLYRELSSTAESGWDFSTRWMRNPKAITTLATTSILPVDLNAYILGMELDISFSAKVAGNDSIAEHFMKASKARETAIESVLWNERRGQWFDYWLSSNNSCKEDQLFEPSYQNRAMFASNFIPLWINPFNLDKNLVEKVVKSLESSGLLFVAGIATSLTNSGQQWDFPNGWAPIQHMIVEGLARSGSSKARSLAEEIAVRWIRTNYAAYKKMGVMHEKYDVQKCGKYGGGGEYVPQTGFGWSNGVVLAFLEEFGWPRGLSEDCQED